MKITFDGKFDNKKYKSKRIRLHYNMRQIVDNRNKDKLIIRR